MNCTHRRLPRRPERFRQSRMRWFQHHVARRNSARVNSTSRIQWGPLRERCHAKSATACFTHVHRELHARQCAGCGARGHRRCRTDNRRHRRCCAQDRRTAAGCADLDQGAERRCAPAGLGPQRPGSAVQCPGLCRISRRPGRRARLRDPRCQAVRCLGLAGRCRSLP